MFVATAPIWNIYSRKLRHVKVVIEKLFYYCTDHFLKFETFAAELVTEMKNEAS